VWTDKQSETKVSVVSKPEKATETSKAGDGFVVGILFIYVHAEMGR